MGEEHGTDGDELPDVGEVLLRPVEEELVEGQHGAVHVLHQVPAPPIQQVVEDGEALLSALLQSNDQEYWYLFPTEKIGCTANHV